MCWHTIKTPVVCRIPAGQWKRQGAARRGTCPGCWATMALTINELTGSEQVIMLLKMISSSSHMHVMNHSWSARKQRLHLQSAAGISRHLALSENRIRPCGTSSESRRKDTDQCLQVTMTEPQWRHLWRITLSSFLVNMADIRLIFSKTIVQRNASYWKH